MKIMLIRHGITPGNLRKAYNGTTDEHLAPEGRLQLEEMKAGHTYPRPEVLYVTPLQRTWESAEILFPGQEQIVVDGLRELDFGEFEEKNYEELKDIPAYQEWLASNGTLPFPGGEDLYSFQARCKKAFLEVMAEYENTASAGGDSVNRLTEADGECTDERMLAFVVHGGTIMAVMSALGVPEQEYFSFMSGNGNGYIADYADGKLLNYRKIFEDEYDRRNWEDEPIEQG